MPPGIVYAIFLKDHDGSVSDLHVVNRFGAVLQAGAEYHLTGRWSVFGDFKEVWLGVNAHGLIGGAVPVTAHVPLNPSLVSAGVKFRFGRVHPESAHLSSEQHQVLEIACRYLGFSNPSQYASPLRRLPRRFKFYLDYGMKHPLYDPEWQIYYPATLK